MVFFFFDVRGKHYLFIQHSVNVLKQIIIFNNVRTLHNSVIREKMYFELQAKTFKFRCWQGRTSVVS